MYSIWKSNLGKLFVGGCGTQLGLLLTVSSLVIVLLFCGVCVFSNALTVGLARQVIQQPTATFVETDSPPAQNVQLLRQQLDLLRVKVQLLQTGVSGNPPPPTATPLPPPKPFALANKSAVNLRSGPGTHYNRIGRMAMGESLPIVGRNGDSTWWLVSTPDGHFAWLADMVVSVFNVDDSIPMIDIPALLVQPTVGAPSMTAADPPAAEIVTPIATPAIDSTPNVSFPSGTPTAVAQASRRFVQDTRGYKQLIRRLLLPTVSESFSPHGDRIAITEKVKLYTITTDGSTVRTLLEDDDTLTLVGGVVWSPDGKYLAFIADKTQDCEPCRTVGLVRMSDGAISFLDIPPDAGVDKPRWTQDGRLLATMYWDKPANGTVYIFDAAGQGQAASGTYLLSSSHDGQKWSPWLPGKIWQADNATETTNYYSD